MKKNIGVILFYFVFALNIVYGQMGRLDPTFNPTDIRPQEAAIFCQNLYTNGKLLFGGEFGKKIIMYNPDGSLDKNFSANLGIGFNGNVYAIESQPDGKILVGGEFTSFNKRPCNRIARLNADGTLDSTFNIGTGFNDKPRKITLQSDGKILLGGEFTTYNNLSYNKIIRLNKNGTVDNSFNIGTGFIDGAVYAITVQLDGKILIGGVIPTYNNTPSAALIRLNTDGTIDTSFNTAGVGFDTYDSVEAITLQPDGKILAGGYFNSYNGVSANMLVRINANGSIDNSFNIGTGFDYSINNIVLLSTGEIIIGGLFKVYNGDNHNYIIGLNADGSIDNSFDKGLGTNGEITSIILQNNGKLMVTGFFDLYNDTPVTCKVSINLNGSIDESYLLGTGFNNEINVVVTQPDDKILVGGYFRSYFNKKLNRIGRLHPDGTLDESFNIGTGFDNIVSVIRLQSDGKIIVGGNFTSYNGANYNRIIRLNSDGSIDNSFNVGIGFDKWVYTLLVQPDGKILVGGYFNSYNGSTSNHIIRLNSDGSIDNSFNVGTGFNNWVYGLALQPDGKIIVGGEFESFNNNTQYSIVRLNTDGTKDNSFNSGFGVDNYVMAVKLQPDGKILAGGNFISYNGITHNRIIRLNLDGGVDNSFDTGTGFFANPTIWGYILDIQLQKDNKILLGGYFSSYNGKEANCIARLNANGTLDTTFIHGTGFDYQINSITIQRDNKILVGGAFILYNNKYQNMLVRLLNCENQATIITDELKKGTIDKEYRGLMEVSNLSGIVKWQIIKGILPEGLLLDQNRGIIYGIPKVKGIYTFTIEATNNLCYAEKELSITIEELSSTRAYPNPSDDKISLNMPIGTYWEIKNSQGQKIMQGNLTANNTISIKGLNSGIYILYYVDIQGQEIMQKIIKL